MRKLKMVMEGAPVSAPFLEILIADSFLARLAGLMFRKQLPHGTGLLLIPCNSVHMCFMRFAIDVVYLDKEYKILKIVRNLKPWTGLSFCRQAYSTLEINVGDTEKYCLIVGEKVILQEYHEL